jgi:hypothetical protein
VVRDFFNIANEKLGPVKHKMRERSTSQTTFKGFKKEYMGTKLIEPPHSLKTDGPFVGESDYNRFFPNWGPQPVFREKTPQYPCYSLPLNGKSTLISDYPGLKAGEPVKLIEHRSSIK